MFAFELQIYKSTKVGLFGIKLKLIQHRRQIFPPNKHYTSVIYRVETYKHRLSIVRISIIVLERSFPARGHLKSEI